MDITTSETDTTEVQKLQDALEVQPESVNGPFSIRVIFLLLN